MKYIIEKMDSYNTIGELEKSWRISYIENCTKYTLPEKFATKKQATDKIKQLTT